MHIIITGVTGIIGRESLIELLLEENNSPGRFSKIICLARKSRQYAAGERISNLIEKICLENDFNIDYVKGLIDVIDTSEDKDLSFEALVNYLNSIQVNNLHVIHLASTTNLSPLYQTEREIYKDSYLPSIKLLQATLPWVKKYSFMSTAFSCGHQDGMIPNSYEFLTIDKHRNYYERYKRMAELEVTRICELNQVKSQILRSCIVSGRLQRKPYYYTPKFNVFYAWTGFFASIRKNNISCDGIRIEVNPNSGVNILPADYVAKACVRAALYSENKELNLVHSKSIPNAYLLTSMLKSVGVENFEVVDRKPGNKTLAEKMYYKTAGSQFSPYLNTTAHEYDTTVLRSLMHDVPEPDVYAAFPKLLEFAVERDFENEVI